MDNDNNNNVILSLRHITKKFKDFTVLNDVSLDVNKGDIYGVLGLSGAGKSTLVRCINGLEKFDSGEIYYKGEKATFDRMYRRKVTMIFQQFNLLNQRNVIKNVELAGEIVNDKNRHEKALKLLELVGLRDKALSYPSELSGGQMQRVAIARALMTDPEILLCDEATSALDPETTHVILDLLKDLNKKLGLTIIIIAHQMTVIEEICNKVAIIDKARIVESGALYDVFLNPKTDITKKLVYSDHLKSKLSQGSCIRIKFNGQVDTPIICNIIQDCNILLSIYYADTKTVDDKVYGQMIFKLPNYDQDIDKLKIYLANKGIEFEEVSDDSFNR